jgi:hypothetical protein
VKGGIKEFDLVDGGEVVRVGVEVVMMKSTDGWKGD